MLKLFPKYCIKSGKICLKPLKRIKDFIIYDLRITFKNFMKHDGELSICALAFYLLISAIPASLIFISILSFFYSTETMAKFYLTQIKYQLPTVDITKLMRILDTIIVSKKYSSFIWIPFLFWWASFIFDIIQQALEKAFQIEEGHKFWKAKIRHFIIILGIGIFILSLTFLSHALALMKNTKIALYVTENINSISFFKDSIIALSKVPLLLSSFTMLIFNTLLIYIIYRFVPPRKINNRSLLKGALFASLCYEAVKIAFSYYIINVNDYTSIFGPLNTIVIMIIWIWYSCFLFVAGAELSYVLYEKSERTKQFDFSS